MNIRWYIGHQSGNIIALITISILFIKPAIQLKRKGLSDPTTHSSKLPKYPLRRIRTVSVDTNNSNRSSRETTPKAVIHSNHNIIPKFNLNALTPIAEIKRDDNAITPSFNSIKSPSVLNISSSQNECHFAGNIQMIPNLLSPPDDTDYNPTCNDTNDALPVILDILTEHNNDNSNEN